VNLQRRTLGNQHPPITMQLVILSEANYPFQIKILIIFSIMFQIFLKFKNIESITYMMHGVSK